MTVKRLSHLTVVMEDTGAAANIGGAVSRRTVHIDLTAEQKRRLEPRNTWESIAFIIDEYDDEGSNHD